MFGQGVRNTHTLFRSKQDAINKLRIGPDFQRNDFEKKRAQNTPYNYLYKTMSPTSAKPKN
jgi:cell division septation protein DedD